MNALPRNNESRKGSDNIDIRLYHLGQSIHVLRQVLLAKQPPAATNVHPRRARILGDVKPVKESWVLDSGVESADARAGKLCLHIRYDAADQILNVLFVLAVLEHQVGEQARERWGVRLDEVWHVLSREHVAGDALRLEVRKLGEEVGEPGGKVRVFARADDADGHVEHLGRRVRADRDGRDDAKGRTTALRIVSRQGCFSCRLEALTPRIAQNKSVF
jgi:hypothetical protein